MSRPVIREALRSLAGQHVIQIVNGKGAVISPLDGYSLGLFFQRAVQMKEQSIEELMEVRQNLEALGARLAAQRRSEQDLEALSTILANMSDANGPRYVELDVEFHIAIARATHNTMLYYIVASIRAALAEIISAVFLRQPSESALDDVLKQSQAMHKEIHQAIEQQDSDAAEKAMLIHLADAAEAVLGKRRSDP